MSDLPRAPGPPKPVVAGRPVPTGRAPAGGPPLLQPPTANPIVRPAPPLPPPPSMVPEPAIPAPQSAAPPAPRTSDGRPVDVQQTSTSGGALVLQGSTVGGAAENAALSGRPADVQLITRKDASTAARTTHALQRTRRSKPKAELDEERGRYRHTLRLTPQSEHKLREIAESLGGVDLNAAIAMCIATYHQSLAKRGKVDG